MNHVWIRSNETVPWDHCKICGIVKRADGQNTQFCRGPTKIMLREAKERRLKTQGLKNDQPKKHNRKHSEPKKLGG